MNTPAAGPLWDRIAAHHIGPAGAALSFAERLARENRWSADYTARVIGEYRRFAYLAVTAGHEVTPSDQVDQAWHLHLTYSRDYWQRFCPEVLGADLHHGPTAGGTAEKSRYFEQYAQTLKSYQEAFGQSPPPDIWPPVRRRFGVDPLAVRVNPVDVMIVPRRAAIVAAAAVLVAALGIMAAAAVLVGGM